MSAADIFASTPGAYTVYRATLQVRDILVGGVPSDPSVIRKWLEARLGSGDERLEEILAETRESRDTAMSTDEQLDVLLASDAAPSINGFKRMDTGELAYEGRCLKGALKEWANSAYPGNNWDGKAGAPGVAPRKGLLSTLAERVFVDETLIPLGVKEPSRVEERVKRVRLPDGRPASALARVEVIDRPVLTATVRVRDDFLTDEALSRIWQTGEEIGIGSDRARSDGKFDLIGWELLTPARKAAAKKAPAKKAADK